MLKYKCKFRYRLRHIFIMFIFLSVAFATLGRAMFLAHRQARGVDFVEKQGGFVLYDFEMEEAIFEEQEYIDRFITDTPPQWAINLFGIDILSRVVYVKLKGDRECDMKWVEDLPYVCILNCKEDSISDRDISHIKKMPNLIAFRCDSQLISDAGLKQLSSIDNLEVLELVSKVITNEGVRHILRMKHLKYLYLFCPLIDDQEILKFKELKDLKYLTFSGDSKVTKNTLIELQKHLPQCEINGVE